MLLSEFYAMIDLIVAALAVIWYALDATIVIDSPQITFLDFILGFIIVDEAWNIIMTLREG